MDRLLQDFTDNLHTSKLMKELIEREKCNVSFEFNSKSELVRVKFTYPLLVHTRFTSHLLDIIVTFYNNDYRMFVKVMIIRDELEVESFNIAGVADISKNVIRVIEDYFVRANHSKSDFTIERVQKRGIK